MKIQLAKMKRILMLCFVFPTSLVLMGAEGGCGGGITAAPFAPGNALHFLLDPHGATQCLADVAHDQALDNICVDLRMMAAGAAMSCYQLLDPDMSWKDRIAAEAANAMLQQVLQIFNDMINAMCGDGDDPQNCNAAAEARSKVMQNKMRCIHAGPTAADDPDGWRAQQILCGRIFDGAIKTLEDVYLACLAQQGGPQQERSTHGAGVPEQAPISRENCGENELKCATVLY